MTWYEFALVQLSVLGLGFFILRWQSKKDSQRHRPSFEDNSELQKLHRMRECSLSMPLSEATRPKKLSDIVGQADAIEALRGALCSKNPQHILIYGPPGVGKTCAARLILEEAKKCPDSPFNDNSQFIELDATCIRFDERAIADPLLGCVHDPIYQGAGQLGSHGIPQPKAGAVTRAHCGVLFLDEIGELHPLQMNKLLKVLEDRCVRFESSYYSKSNRSIPAYIHDIFKNGLPADFRLIGATTRSPEEIPPALRSRCIEIFFSPLSDDNLRKIGANAAVAMGKNTNENVLALCASYSESGRDCVSIMQLAGSMSNNADICTDDIERVARVCRYVRKYSFTMPCDEHVGRAYGLGVSQNSGVVLEIECSVKRTHDRGTLEINGAITEEEIAYAGRRLMRKSLAVASVENAVRAASEVFGVDCTKYDIIFNIPGGLPVDGPSAGAAFCAALISALTMRPLKANVAITGEITTSGELRPVGGIREKAEAALCAGATCIIVPKQNLHEALSVCDCAYGASDIRELMRMALSVKKITPGFLGVKASASEA